MAVLNFLTHQVVHVMLEFRQLACEFLEFIDRELAQTCALQGFCGAGVCFTTHAVQAHKFARHKEPGNLLFSRSEEHTSELQSRENLVCRLLPEQTNRAGARSE